MGALSFGVGTWRHTFEAYSSCSVLGRRIVTVFGGDLDIEIVGVVENVFIDIRDAEPLALYMPVAQQARPSANRALVFRAADDMNAARRKVIAAVRQLDSRLQLPDGMTLDERLLRQMAPQLSLQKRWP